MLVYRGLCEYDICWHSDTALLSDSHHVLVVSIANICADSGVLLESVKVNWKIYKKIARLLLGDFHFIFYADNFSYFL